MKYMAILGLHYVAFVGAVGGEEKRRTFLSADAFVRQHTLRTLILLSLKRFFMVSWQLSLKGLRGQNLKNTTVVGGLTWA